MEIYERYWKIPEYKVAVKDWSLIPEDEQAERLEFQKFRDNDGNVTQYSIIDALEVRAIQFDFASEPLILTWDLISFGVRELEI